MMLNFVVMLNFLRSLKYKIVALEIKKMLTFKQNF